MDAQRYGRLEALFREVCDLPQAERTAAIAAACGDDATLAADLKALLAAAPGAEDFFDALAERCGPRPAPEGASILAAGTRIGAWRIEKPLGAGGMGVVYEAERADGEYNIKGAVKVMKLGLDTEEIVRRFEQERQILADLDHPAIARLLDGGHTEDGRPYFVMELARGEPLDAWCDRRRLGIAERLRLFLDIARAVRHAHRRLVIHRDLKPSNIVVTPEGKLKLLDFGIAKLLDPDSGGELTRTRMHFLTPGYASPEQLQGKAVTTASDVYQLGLVLYLLLSGRRAYDLKGMSAAEVEKVVCEHDPPLPSGAVVGLDEEGAAAIATARNTSPKQLRKRLQGDLDAIVLTALAKDPERRYGSGEQMIADIERHLAGQPVQARRPTLGYRAGRFLVRNKWSTATAAAFAGLLVAYAATVTLQANRLEAERDRVRIEAAKAERVRDFLVNVFGAANPYRIDRERVTASEIVEAGVEAIRTELHDESEVRAELLGVLGIVLHSLGESERGHELTDEALALQRELHSKDHPDLAKAIHMRAVTISNQDQESLETKERLAREALEMRRRIYGDDHAATPASLSLWAGSLMLLSRFTEAESALGEALAIRARLGLAEDLAMAGDLYTRGAILHNMQRYIEAETAHRQALEIRERLLPVDHPIILQSLNLLAITLSHQGRYDEAEAFLREVLVTGSGEEPDYRAFHGMALEFLGDVLYRSGRLEESDQVIKEALEGYRTIPGNQGISLSRLLNSAGVVARRRSVLDEAEQYFSESLSILQVAVPEEYHRIGWTMGALGWILWRQGRIEEATPLLERSPSFEAPDFDAYFSPHESRVALGLLRATQGRKAEARALIEPGLAGLQDEPLADPAMIDEAIRVLATLSED